MIVTQPILFEILGQTAVWKVESKTTPKTFHLVHTSRGGIRCSCLGYEHRHECEHCRRVRDAIVDQSYRIQDDDTLVGVGHCVNRADLDYDPLLMAREEEGTEELLL